MKKKALLNILLQEDAIWDKLHKNQLFKYQKNKAPK